MSPHVMMVLAFFSTNKQWGLSQTILGHKGHATEGEEDPLAQATKRLCISSDCSVLRKHGLREFCSGARCWFLEAPNPVSSLTAVQAVEALSIGHKE